MASNSSLSDSDMVLLKTIGGDIIRNTVSLVVEAILYTVYFTLVTFAGRILLSSKGRNKMTIATFAVVLLMLMLDTVLCILDVRNAILEVSSTLTSSSADSLQDRYDRYNSRNATWAVENALFSFMYNLGDIIIIWRASAFYYQYRERWLLLIPSALLVGSFIISSLISYCIANGAVSEVSNFVSPPLCVHIQITSYGMTFATTAVSTLMICWKTWVYRRAVQSFDTHSPNRKTRVEKILIVLIESGLLYLVFLLAIIVNDVGDVPDLETSTSTLVFSTQVWSFMLSHIVGIYPAIIVLLVHSRKSYIDGVTHSTLDPTVSTSSSLKWAVAPLEQESTATQHDNHIPGRNHVLHINVHETQGVHHGDSTSNDTTSDRGSEKSREMLPPPGCKV